MADAPKARWLRIQVSMDVLDPWTILLPLQDDGTRLMAWSSPEGNDRFVAAGAVAEFRPAGEDRFKAARDWWGPIASQMVSQDAHGNPLANTAPACLAGFAFRSNPHRSSDWNVWGDGALCVPETVVWRQGGKTVAVFTIDNQAGPVTAQLARLRAQLHDWVSRATAAKQWQGAAVIDASAQSDSAREQWARRVEAAQAAMASGELKKVVLARSAAFTPGETQHFDPLATAWALSKRQVHSTTFMIRRRDGQAFLGSSPETLVQLKGGHVETVALAGTRRRDPLSPGEDAALGVDLLDSPKDRAEQLLVEEAIVEALAPHVHALIVPDQPIVVRHPDVQHLKTTIRGQLSDDATIFELLDRLHPTPAVGGLPRSSALAWLGNHEKLDRGWYAGPIGWISQSGEGVFVVAIRSVLMARDSAAAFAGCGLIADSNPADEWEESQIKLQTVRQGLAAHGPVEPHR